MTDFISKLETLLPCKELLFNGTPGFGRYAHLLAHSAAHPAKMNTRLTEYLIIELTKPGEMILDPMSGTGQTGLIAALNSRDAVCVELEDKFHNWQLKAKNKLDSTQTFIAKGSLNCILGDARNLSKLMPTVDAVVTSPPYSGSVTGSDPNPERRAERMLAAGHDPKTILGGEARVALIEWRYAKRENKGNIGNLSHGEIDAVITSPPYEKTIKDHGTSERATKINLEKNNLSSWAYNPENPDNIGNKSKETYLQAMFQVYAEMFKVLKPGGTAAIIVKPFIRNRQVVDLPFQTWQLLEKCGFQLTKLFKLRLDMQSFWRILYMQKNPQVPQIWHEYVLVCTKPASFDDKDIMGAKT